ncbi:MAG: acetyl-CoA carboxylase biotin carboxylase subunit [Acidobacteriaceae bacterium]
MFRKVLIANRGEIALRILRACRELGISTVAVYSDADRAAPHVLEANEAYRLGLAPATESYLRGDLILDIARRTRADAIHPGYGFLSENADFAQSCEHAGIRFIGPTSSAMRILGSKTNARQAADEAGMPRTPGCVHGLASPEEALDVAAGVGYPVMLKAAAGGGGKGMRAVARPEDLPSAFAEASSEAERAFGSGEVYLEKLIDRPRHIEIQILADEHGHCVSLGERECSVQRRHQKVIEEAPSPVVDPMLRRRMGEAAVKLALSAGYTNAGTVEFLVDDNRNFYFLEMNTRLQVEHPVTELVTGYDLVHLQIRVAQGEPLPFTQKDVQLRGHAIECRIYAEDPANGFMPSPGRITRLLQPGGPGIREDSGIYEGWVVPMDYDPMLSKLIAYAPTRELAIARLQRALDEYVVGGIRTNLGLFRRILSDPDFCAARLDTGYLDRLLTQVPEAMGISLNGAGALPAVAAAAFFEATKTTFNGNSHSRPVPAGGWKTAARREAVAEGSGKASRP